MKAIDVMFSVLAEAQATGHTPLVPTRTQLVNLANGKFGRVETVRMHGKQGVVRLVCTHGVLDLSLSPGGMRALEVLFALECNPPEDAVSHVQRVEMGEKDDYGGAAEFHMNGERKS